MDALFHEASLSASPVREADSGERKGIWNVKLISSDVQGSSGYYPREVLERDGPLVFPAGTHVYFDHPSTEEEWSRPERSVRDLAGSFETGAVFREDGGAGPGLYANVRMFPEADKWLEPRKESVGMSIRAQGTAAETDDGYTITSLTEGLSVDIVTRAGAGGKVLQLMESKKDTPQTGAQNGADLASLNQTVSGLVESNSKVTEVLTKLVEAMTPSEKEEKTEALTAVELVTKLNESGLPDAARSRVAQVYKPGDDVTVLIAQEAAYVTALTEAAKGKKVTRSEDAADGTTGVVEESGTGGNTDDKAQRVREAANLLGLEG